MNNFLPKLKKYKSRVFSDLQGLKEGEKLTLLEVNSDPELNLYFGMEYIFQRECGNTISLNWDDVIPEIKEGAIGSWSESVLNNNIDGK